MNNNSRVTLKLESGIQRLCIERVQSLKIMLMNFISNWSPKS